MAGPYTAFTYGDPKPSSPVISRVAVSMVGVVINTIPSAFTAPRWPTMTFPDASQGQAYSETFDLYPASAPTTFTLLSGSLPTGLSLSNVSNDVGKIEGTPTVAATYTFTLRATNAYGMADQAFTLIVQAGGSGGGGSWCFIS